MKSTTLRMFAILSILATPSLLACSAGDDSSDAEITEETQQAACSAPASCVEVHACTPSAADGPQTIYYQGLSNQPFRAYCTGMSGGSPSTYLALSKTGNATSPTYNYSQVLSVQGNMATSSYTRLKIDPASLLIDTSDQTFSSFSGSGFGATAVAYAASAGCTSAGAIANVDLHGMPFTVAASAFQINGSNGSTISPGPDNQSIQLFAKGNSSNCDRVQPILDTKVYVFDTPSQNAGGSVLGLSYAAQCTDGLMNGNETGVDCGGPCGACPSEVSIPASTQGTDIVGGAGGIAFADACHDGQVLIGFSGHSSGGSPSYLSQLQGICATVSVPAQTPPPPFAPTVTSDHSTSPPEGTNTGTAGTVQCPANSIVIGFQASTISSGGNPLVGELGLVCAPLLVSLSGGAYSMAVDLSQKTTTASGSMLNSAAGGTVVEKDCPSGLVSVKLAGSANTRVNSLYLRCSAPVLMCGTNPC